jgi:hypothetical protein
LIALGKAGTVFGCRIRYALFLRTEPSPFELSAHFWWKVLGFVDSTLTLVVTFCACGNRAGDGCELLRWRVVLAW